MGMTANQIAKRFVGAAQKYPGDRPEIFRKASYTFMGLAQDPKNARSSQKLASIGLEFAAAAHRERPAVMDDFTDLLRETAEAYEQVGDDPMDLVARRREIHDERTPLMPGQVSIAPESFNRDATLGRSAVIQNFTGLSPDQIQALTAIGVQESQNVAFWQGVKKEAQAMTVDISLGFLPTLAVVQGESFSSTNVRPFTEIQYGSDGNRTTVRADLALGNRFTVVGNYIAVTIGMAPPMAGSVSTRITAGASIGAFAAPSQAPIFFTEYIDTLVIGATTPIIPIPLKAVQLAPLQTNLPLGDSVRLRFFDYGGALISQNFYVQAANVVMQPIPITGDVAFVDVQNNSATTALTARLPFQLGM